MNIKDEAVELKPCPFCASRVLNQFKDDDFHIIQCAQCGCEIRHMQHHKVVAAWNRRALSSARVEVRELVSVKPLEWRDIRATHEAYTLFGGAYIITAYAGMAEPFKLEKRGFDGSLSTYYRHLDEAKAAAQADYERRVLSALASHEPAPEPAKDGPEVVAHGESYGDGILAVSLKPGRHYNIPLVRLSDYEALRAENERLREALEPFALVAEHDIGDGESDDDIFWPISNARYSMAGRLRVGHLRRARAALEAAAGALRNWSRQARARSGP